MPFLCLSISSSKVSFICFNFFESGFEPPTILCLLDPAITTVLQSSFSAFELVAVALISSWKGFIKFNTTSIKSATVVVISETTDLLQSCKFVGSTIQRFSHCIYKRRKHSYIRSYNSLMLLWLWLWLWLMVEAENPYIHSITYIQ